MKGFRMALAAVAVAGAALVASPQAGAAPDWSEARSICEGGGGQFMDFGDLGFACWYVLEDGRHAEILCLVRLNDCFIIVWPALTDEERRTKDHEQPGFLVRYRFSATRYRTVASYWGSSSRPRSVTDVNTYAQRSGFTNY